MGTKPYVGQIVCLNDEGFNIIGKLNSKQEIRLALQPMSIIVWVMNLPQIYGK
jgi:hypothetical protein